MFPHFHLSFPFISILNPSPFTQNMKRHQKNFIKVILCSYTLWQKINSPFSEDKNITYWESNDRFLYQWVIEVVPMSDKYIDAVSQYIHHPHSNYLFIVYLFCKTVSSPGSETRPIWLLSGTQYFKTYLFKYHWFIKYIKC